VPAFVRLHTSRHAHAWHACHPSCLQATHTLSCAHATTVCLLGVVAQVYTMAKAQKEQYYLYEHAFGADALDAWPWAKLGVRQ
jgi:hypothetical protein